MYKQNKAFNSSVKGERGYCLAYVRKAYAVNNIVDTAYNSWIRSKYKHSNKDFPTNDIYIPIWWNYHATIDGIYDNYGHVAVLECSTGRVYSNPGKNTASNPVVFKSIDEITDYYGLETFLGWSEDVNGEKVIEYVAVDGSIETLAKEVIKGLWGNGTERKKRLESAGYDYQEIQTKVNELLNGKISSVINIKSGTTLYNENFEPYTLKTTSDHTVTISKENQGYYLFYADWLVGVTNAWVKTSDVGGET